MLDYTGVYKYEIQTPAPSPHMPVSTFGIAVVIN